MASKESHERKREEGLVTMETRLAELQRVRDEAKLRREEESHRSQVPCIPLVPVQPQELSVLTLSRLVSRLVRCVPLAVECGLPKSGEFERRRHIY